MQPEEASRLREIVIECTRHVLPSCGIGVGETLQAPAGDGDAQQVVAFMGFTGDALRGTIAVVAPLEMLRVAYPLPLVDVPQWKLEVFDWAGEIANRLLGRIRGILQPQGVHIEASTPRVMQGEQLHLTRSTQATICSACFSANDSWVRVWFDALSPDDRPLFSESRDLTDDTPAEGEPVLF